MSGIMIGIEREGALGLTRLPVQVPGTYAAALLAHDPDVMAVSLNPWLLSWV